jgi:hypothetical protein
VKTPQKRRDGARSAVPPDVESRPTGDWPPDGQSALDPSLADPPSVGIVHERRADRGLVVPSGPPKGLAGAFAAFAASSATEPRDFPPGWQVDTAGEQSAPDPNAHQKRLASKAAYRMRRSADDAFREKERERVREWRRNNPDKTRAQKAKSRAANYLRPIVAIDSEGQDYPKDDIWYDGVRYPSHGTYLWGAAADDGRAPVWLTAAETHGMDKRPLSVVEILDWLLDLPRQYGGKAVFVMFSFKYDIAQILKRLPYFKVWEIFKHKTYRDKNGVIRQIGHAPIFWKKYAIHYIDGKVIDIKRLTDPEKPLKSKRAKYSARIRIYDVFGFFQSSFSAVVDGMVQSGRATSDEAAFVRKMKGRRENFASEDIDKIKTYTAIELRLLARMITDLRKGFDETGLHLRDWHGAGAAAAALIEAEKLKAHYGPDIAASNITPQQGAAHHAYFGGRIELLKQGYIENGVLHSYDIAVTKPEATASETWVKTIGMVRVYCRSTTAAVVVATRSTSGCSSTSSFAKGATRASPPPQR